MREELLKLCQLQEIDLSLDAHERALAALDDGHTTRAELAELTAAAAQAEQQRQHLEGECFERDLELKGIEEKKKHAEELMSSGRVTNLRQLEDLQKEAAMFDREIDRLSTQILELMDELEAARRREAESKSGVEAAKTRLETILEKYDKTGARLRQEVAELKAQRAAFLPTIAEAVRQRYDQVRSRQGVLAVGEVDDDICGGCHVALPHSILKTLQDGKVIQLCDSCGRILVWTGGD